jgi:hypothetical protein
MKKYLYEIHEGGVSDPFIPWMPRVLAEKTARSIRKTAQRNGWRRPKYKTAKAATTGDVSPHGVTDWFDYIAERRAQQWESGRK